MKCDRCDKEATVHELRVVKGVKVEKHLCEHCAKQDGIAVQSQVPIDELISKYVMAQGASATETAKAGRAPAACARCGLTYAEYRQAGLLGCPECYRAFGVQLGPLLERAHEGGTHHVGKVPRHALARRRAGAEDVLGGPAGRAERIATIRRQLSEAIRAEQYERAAALRDELARFSDGAPPAAAAPARAKRSGGGDA